MDAATARVLSVLRQLGHVSPENQAKVIISEIYWYFRELALSQEQLEKLISEMDQSIPRDVWDQFDEEY